MMLKTKLIYEFSLSAVARVLELKNRFSQGLEKLPICCSLKLKCIKELEYIQSVFEYNLANQYLQFLTKNKTMKKITSIILLAVTVLFASCGKKEKEISSDEKPKQKVIGLIKWFRIYFCKRK
jgi:hypothetical protein